jgi:RNA polymerase sigma-70 factor (ECF subfamily)
LIPEKVKLAQESHEVRNLMFAEAASQCRAMLLSRAHRIAGSREEAEDIVQDVYLKALKGLPRFRGDSKMETWLYSIMRNAALEHLRNRKRRVADQQTFVRSENDEETTLEVPDTRADPEEACARSEMEQILLSEIDKLDSGCRHTLQMCFLNETPYLIAAESLHVRVSTVKSRVFRSKRILRKALSPCFATSSVQGHLLTDQPEDR